MLLFNQGVVKHTSKKSFYVIHRFLKQSI